MPVRDGVYYGYGPDDGSRIGEPRPSALYRPILRKWEWPDERGTYWTATYGDLEVKGKSPKDAMTQFDHAWQRYEYLDKEKNG